MSELEATSTKDTNPSISSNTRSSTAELRKIDLVGHTAHQITGAKLPSKRQVLQTFFYNMRFVNMNSKDAASLAIDATLIFWQQARIPTQYKARIADKLKKLYDNWKSIQKVVPSKRAGQTKKAEEKFVDSLDDLFDIASADAFETMRNEEHKNFLKKQREKGRPGCLIGVDMSYHRKERRSQSRRERAEILKRKHDAEMS